MAIKSFRDLIVWQKAMQLSFIIYELTKKFPKDERYVLVSQMRRCAVSIPSNIAEGRRRGSKKDFARFVQIAFGSGAELETQLEIAFHQKYFDEVDYIDCMNLLSEVMKMLNALERSLNPKS